MSRIAKKPVELPKGVELKESAGELSVKGPKGELQLSLNSEVAIKLEDNVVTFEAIATKS